MNDITIERIQSLNTLHGHMMNRIFEGVYIIGKKSRILLYNLGEYFYRNSSNFEILMS